MREKKRWLRAAAAASALALLATACGGNGDTTPSPGPTTAPPGTTDPTEAPTTPGETPDAIEIGVGVSEDPCPDAVNDDTGCIYLGSLTDLTGPFQVVGTQFQEGQRLFWEQINEAGGIGGFEIDIDTYLRDTAYNVTNHVTAYNEIRDAILALGTTLGTPHTEAILPDMESDDIVALPATLWSGWDYTGNVLGLGSSYCVQSAIHLDWANEQAPVGSVIAVGFPGDYGGDVAAGAELWAEEAGAEWLGFLETGPTAQIGNQDAAIGQVVASGADVVVLGVAPTETAQIVGGAAVAGFQGRFLGALPSWNAALVNTEAMPALAAMYTQVSGIGNWDAETPGHQAMRDALGGSAPVNEYFTLGWFAAYATQALLESAVAAGDLTRAGLVAAAEDLQIDFRGMADPLDYSADVNDRIVRTGVINQPDADAELGVTSVADSAGGAVASAIQLNEPCTTF